jgi:hypothetical protein
LLALFNFAADIQATLGSRLRGNDNMTTEIASFILSGNDETRAGRENPCM